MDGGSLPDARAWAREVPARDAQPAALEAHVLRAHPRVLAMLGWQRADARPGGQERRLPRRGRPAASGPVAWLRSLVVLVAFLAPIVGAAMLSLGGPVLLGRVLRADSTPIPVAVLLPVVTLCFLLALVQMVAGLRAWGRRGRIRRRHDLVQPMLLLGLSVVAIAGLVERADEADATVPIVVTVAAAAASLLHVVLLARSPRALGASGWIRSGRAAQVDAAVAALAALPEAERAALQRERDEALRVLVERGCLDEQRAQRAARAPLGSLSTR